MWLCIKINAEDNTALIARRHTTGIDFSVGIADLHDLLRRNNLIALSRTKNRVFRSYVLNFLVKY